MRWRHKSRGECGRENKTESIEGKKESGCVVRQKKKRVEKRRFGEGKVEKERNLSKWEK